MISLWIIRLSLLIISFIELGFPTLKAEDPVGTDDKKQVIQKESSGEDVEEEELTGGVQTDQVLIRGLNKVTAHISDFVVPIGQKAKFGHLEITARLCQKSPPEDPPESTAYLEIQEVKPGEKSSLIFSGWMFASSPDISALEHPVYDLWVLNCQGHIIHELPALDAGSYSLPFENSSLQPQELLSKTPAADAFNRGFTHSR